MAVKILAVDDSPTMRQILELTFAGEDAEVTTVESGQKAVDTAASLKPDVVMSSVTAPLRWISTILQMLRNGRRAPAQGTK